MKKKILTLILAFCLILPCAFMFNGCKDNITDIAYVQLVPAETSNKVLYYSDTSEHIYLVPNESSSKNDYLLKITFEKYICVKSFGEKTASCINIESWSSMSIAIKNEYYDASKKVYLNGEDITEKRITADASLSTTDVVYRFENFGLVKGNDSEYINIIEYK